MAASDLTAWSVMRRHPPLSDPMPALCTIRPPVGYPQVSGLHELALLVANTLTPAVQYHESWGLRPA